MKKAKISKDEMKAIRTYDISPNEYLDKCSIENVEFPKNYGNFCFAEGVLCALGDIFSSLQLMQSDISEKNENDGSSLYLKIKDLDKDKAVNFVINDLRNEVATAMKMALDWKCELE